MTEAEWNACTDPQPMLEFLRGKVSDRKLRLFATACCRRLGDLLTDRRSWLALDLAEQLADTPVEQATIDRVRQDAQKADEEAPTGGFAGLAARTALCTLVEHPTAREVMCNLAWAVTIPRPKDPPVQAEILRDLLGNPFRPVTIEPQHRNASVVQLAQAIYEERAFDRLPILADALEDAGCTNLEVLSHWRSGGEHVRGCWVVDLLLGKE